MSGQLVSADVWATCKLCRVSLTLGSRWQFGHQNAQPSRQRSTYSCLQPPLINIQLWGNHTHTHPTPGPKHLCTTLTAAAGLHTQCSCQAHRLLHQQQQKRRQQQHHHHSHHCFKRQQPNNTCSSSSSRSMWHSPRSASGRDQMGLYLLQSVGSSSCWTPSRAAGLHSWRVWTTLSETALWV